MAYEVLWVDDQFEELRSHVVYLGERGYAVEGATNGSDALQMLGRKRYDAVLLDEMMPGLGGLQTLEEIKRLQEHLPVIMVTKSEAEDLMSRAIGKRIDDYLVKPVSPVQVLSALKRQLEARRLTGEMVTRDYLSHFADVDSRISSAKTPADWEQLYVDLVGWGLDLHAYSDHGLLQTHAEQMAAANLALGRFVRERYADWVAGKEAPVLSPDVVKKWVAPELEQARQVFLIVIDCMRLDQWRLMEPLIEQFYAIERRHYWSILPSATPYARNALFAGQWPLEIARKQPQWWVPSHAHEGSRNAFEEQLLGAQLERLRSPAAGSLKYFKMSDARETDQLRRQLGSLGDIRLVAGVYNFLDIVAHGRSQSQILKELAPDEAAFRSLMRSWFAHSTLFEVLREVSRKPDTVVLVTTDHGSMLCRKSSLVKGNREASNNVRYKFGDNLAIDQRQVFLLKEPERYGLPSNGPIENYAITTESYYLIYPTNFHEYERLYRDSFQHGGISLEELICPFVVLRPR